MILGVLSDTHGNRTLMHQAARELTGTLGATLLFHLGDDYADGRELSLSGYTVRQVPGLWCAEYHDSRIPKRLAEDMDGITVACAHADKDLRAPERAAGIVLVGHTHEARIMQLGRSLYVNPGHLKTLVSRGERASFAFVEIRPAEVCARIYDVESLQMRFEVCVDRDRLG